MNALRQESGGWEWESFAARRGRWELQTRPTTEWFYPVASIFQCRFITSFDRRSKVAMGAYQPRACIPAQNRIIVAGGTDRLRLLVPRHRFPERVVRHATTSHFTAVKVRLTTALGSDAGIVS